MSTYARFAKPALIHDRRWGLSPYRAAMAALFLGLCWPCVIIAQLEVRNAGASVGPTIVVKLRPTATVDEPLVTIATVADIDGGDSWVRQKIATLDLAEVAPNIRALVVSREQVAIRIQLAGFGVQRFRMDGPAQTVVKVNTAKLIEQTEPVIHTRDLVKIVANAGNLRITTTGESLQDGKIGQLIRVRITDSPKIVAGRVLDRSTVELEY
jgi:Chaperone for flagella basal body P-ring formation